MSAAHIPGCLPPSRGPPPPICSGLKVSSLIIEFQRLESWLELVSMAVFIHSSTTNSTYYEVSRSYSRCGIYTGGQQG